MKFFGKDIDNHYLFSFIFSCFFCFSLFGQSYSFKNYSIAEGLAQTQVTAITEDENGYLWIGTLGGLSRFNGSTFTNFSSDDGLLNNRITALYQDKKGLWIGHESGVSLCHNKTFKKWSIKKGKETPLFYLLDNRGVALLPYIWRDYLLSIILN